MALKLIAPELSADVSFRERFRREARIAAAIDHANILPVHEAQETADGRLLIAMRLVNGGDLGAYLREHGPLTPHEAVRLLSQVGDALDAAHAVELVHRDVKPANVLLERRSDGRLVPYLTDFGLAKRAGSESAQTETGKVVGTIDYMAPEQVSGARGIDGRVEVYAFGCVLYTCLTGEAPYPRETQMATMLAHVHEPVPVPSAIVRGLPPAVDKVVARAMAKDRERRARSAGALMRWAAEQLGPEPELRPDPEPSGETELLGSDERAPEPSTVRLVLLDLVILAPLWAVSYVIGTHL